MKLEFSRQFLEKYSNSIFNENPFSGEPSLSMRTNVHGEGNSSFRTSANVPGFSAGVKRPPT